MANLPGSCIQLATILALFEGLKVHLKDVKYSHSPCKLCGGLANHFGTLVSLFGKFANILDNL